MRTSFAAIFAAVPLLASAQHPPTAETAAAQPPQLAAPPAYAPPPAPPPAHYTAPPQVQVVQPPQPSAPPPQVAPPTSPPPVLVAPRQARSPWYAAFSIGGGDGSIRLPASNGQPRTTASLHDFFGKGPTTFAFDLDVGATLTPRLLVGGELTVFAAAAAYDTFYGTATRSLGMTNLNAVATFYPFERGLFLRGGVGLASIAFASEVPNGSGKTKTSDSHRGADVALGAGYAFWLGQRFNLSLNLDGSRQFFGGSDKVSGASFWRLGLGLGWY